MEHILANHTDTTWWAPAQKDMNFSSGAAQGQMGELNFHPTFKAIQDFPFFYNATKAWVITI